MYVTATNKKFELKIGSLLLTYLIIYPALANFLGPSQTVQEPTIELELRPSYQIVFFCPNPYKTVIITSSFREIPY